MGEQTVVNSRIAAPRGESSIRPIRLGIDVPFVLVVIFLLGFGILMVYSASWQPSILAEKPITYFFLNQLRWVFVGIGVAVFLMYVDYRRWKKLAHSDGVDHDRFVTGSCSSWRDALWCSPNVV
ncbi:MAG: hypothetical protein KatS3mg047_0341 [Bellilinea sp.]|nr:MAG: hypothetical protein KatS3mg047_0341 [Bellilinea sp.]